MLQEQNGQGNLDTLTGHHLQPPGQQPRNHHGSTEGKKKLEKVNIPNSKLVIILPANGTVHHEVHLQGVRESEAGSSSEETQETTQDRNLLVQTPLALNHRGNN